MSTYADPPRTIKIEVTGDKAAAEHFIDWLCGQGEQDYWIWMECREGEENGPITAIRIDYDYENSVAVGRLGRLTPEFDD